MIGDRALEARAKDVLAKLGEHVLSVAPEGVANPWLMDGSAGFALCHAYLSPVLPEQAHEAAAQRHLHQATAALGGEPWLHRGLTGVAWLMDHLAGEPGGGPDGTPAVDEAMARVLDGPRPPLDLMYGVAGFVAYLTTRPASDLRDDLLSRLGRVLVTSATPEAWYPDDLGRLTGGVPFANLGFAHGTPGVLASLVAILSAGVEVEGGREHAVRIIRWLLARRLPGNPENAFPMTTRDTDDKPARTAWCYGDIGVAWSLLLAARVLRDAEVERTALAIARRAAARPLRHTTVLDSCFCHGSAGLAHLSFAFWRATGEEGFRAAGERWIAVAVEQYDPTARFGYRFAGREADRPGLLAGTAGVALVLASACYPELGSEWDRPFLVMTPASA